MLKIHVLLLLIVQVLESYRSSKADAALLSISPDRLQFFEYESFSLNCEDADVRTEWSIVRKVKENSSSNGSSWKTSVAPCSISPAFSTDSGEYWCEAGWEARGHVVNISVTTGDVILESPVRAVMEGEAVILRCRQQTASTTNIGDFYKNGSQIITGYSGQMTIRSVSTLDEGFYRCSIPGVGESPESLLAVREGTRPEQSPEAPPSQRWPLPSPLLWAVVSVLSVVLLLLLGLTLCHKRRVGCFSSETTTPVPDSEASAADSCNATYTAVTKQKKKRNESGSGPSSGQRSANKESLYSTVVFHSNSSVGAENKECKSPEDVTEQKT
ncbi:hypothetical protein LDENG_00238550 [Lucifuga dentata]|nr:hypothetical protein LDENG_00238550 [Lucifuga dentata]